MSDMSLSDMSPMICLFSFLSGKGGRGGIFRGIDKIFIPIFFWRVWPLSPFKDILASNVSCSTQLFCRAVRKKECVDTTQCTPITLSLLVLAGFGTGFPDFLVFEIVAVLSSRLLFFEWGDYRVLFQVNYHPIGARMFHGKNMRGLV